jgi:hypothetical protein
MATEAQRSALRLDTGTTVSSLSDTEIDDIFAAGATLYTGSSSLTAYTRVVVFRRLLALAASRADYTQNQSSERAGMIFDHYKSMIEYWEGELSGAAELESTSGMMRWGSMKRNPARMEEFPDA